MTTSEKRKVDKLKSEGKTPTAIAKELNLSVNTVKSYFRRKSNDGDLCPICNVLLNHIEGKKKKTYCSDKCRMKHWNMTHKKTDLMIEVVCPTCKKTFYAYESKRRKYCSRSCYLGGSNDEK